MNCSENKSKVKREKWKRRRAQKAVIKGAGLQEVASETNIAPFRKEAPVDESIKPVSEKDSCVEPTMNLSSNSGLIEVQSNSNLIFSENKNKRKRERKKRRKAALKADNTDVDLHKVASKTATAPFRIEALVDDCIKPVSESTPLEVELPDDLSKKMDFVAASVEIEAAVGMSSNNCIKEDGTGFTSFGYSEEAHVAGFSENKLDIELERKDDASVQVLEDIMMREELVDCCSDGKPVCKDNEKRMKMKILKEDEENLERKNRGELKEKTSDSISGFDTFCNHQVQMNAELETQVEEMFSSSSHLGVTKNDVVDVTGTEDNLLQKSHPSSERAFISRCKKKLLVLDLNGLLADIVSDASYGYKPDMMISKKAVFKRPYCDDFLQFCFEKFNVGVWSSRIKQNAEKVVEFLMGDSRRKLLFIWDSCHCSKTGCNTIEKENKPLVLKELKKLWDKLEPDLPWEKGEYNETNTLLVDDSPYKAIRNPVHTAIFPNSYEYKDANDYSLGPGGDLRVYLEGLAAAENVQEYVQQNPFGQRAITESSPYWSFYSKIIDTKPSQPHYNSNTLLQIAM